MVIKFWNKYLSCSVFIELESNYQQPTNVIEPEMVSLEPQTSSLLDEVLQAFTDIYSEPEPLARVREDPLPIKPPPKPERSEPTSPQSPTMHVS